jgi:hypothetical protein
MNADRSSSFGLPYGLGRALWAGLAYFCLAAITIALTSDGRNHATIWVADPVILALCCIYRGRNGSRC